MEFQKRSNNKQSVCLIIHVKPQFSTDDAWHALVQEGLTPLYVEEDLEKLAKIYVQDHPAFDKTKLSKKFPFIQDIHYEELPSIDWQEQWQEHCQKFDKGFLIVEVKNAINKKWETLRLKPGSGFGDLSHPTTRLCLKMMHHKVKDKVVIDIGTGSGILALYAIALGAKRVIAIDIDKQALEHAKENAILNDMGDFIDFQENHEFQDKNESSSTVIVMNMISSEQTQALSSLPTLKASYTIVSGLLKEELNPYIKEAEKKGWSLEATIEEEGWLGLEFQS